HSLWDLPEGIRLRQDVVRRAVEDLQRAGFLPRSKIYISILLELVRLPSSDLSAPELRAMEASLVQAFSQGLSIQSAVDRNSNWVSLGGGPAEAWSEQERSQFNDFIFTELLLADLHRLRVLEVARQLDKLLASLKPHMS
ncbi:MAG: hypothetical protein AAB425_05375, partial [Bdellovibrionota bacterium]